MADTKEILTFAVELGDSLLRNGAEVYRIEDSVMAILEANDITDGDVYVLSNGIFASANELTEDSCSIIRHVPLAPMHLGRISALNALCREVCDGTITIEEAWDKLEECKKIPTYKDWLLILASGIGSGCFSFLFGGTAYDAVYATVIGFILQFFLNILARNNTSKAVKNVLASALVSILAIAFFALGRPIQFDKVIIGDIMPLVPGIPLTNSVRDFINGDYLSGSIRLIDALLTAFCIAVGVGTVITVTHLFLGGIVL